MEKISLYTIVGEFVTEVDIPALTPRADGLMWGSRFFIYKEEFGQYREGLLFYCIEGLSNKDED